MLVDSTVSSSFEFVKGGGLTVGAAPVYFVLRSSRCTIADTVDRGVLLGTYATYGGICFAFAHRVSITHAFRAMECANAFSNGVTTHPDN